MACLIVLADHVAAASPGIEENLWLESQASPSLSNISHQPIFDFLVNPNLVNLKLYLVTYTFDTITVSLLIGEVTNLFILSRRCAGLPGGGRPGARWPCTPMDPKIRVSSTAPLVVLAASHVAGAGSHGAVAADE